MSVRWVVGTKVGLLFAFFIICLSNLLQPYFSNLSEAYFSLSYPLIFPWGYKWPPLSLTITFFCLCIYKMSWETSCTIPGKVDNKQDRNSCINTACIKHALVWSDLRVGEGELLGMARIAPWCKQCCWESTNQPQWWSHANAMLPKATGIVERFV